MNLPNKLTLLRALLIPFIIAGLYIDNVYAKIISLFFFVIAVITDVLDGKIAVKRGLKTKFGLFMDPIVDKILVSALFICFTELGIVPAWMTIIIIAREFTISGIRSVAAAEGNIIGANIWGKTKAGIQMLTITAVLFLITLEYATGPGTEINALLNIWMIPIIFFLSLITVIITIISILVVTLLIYRK